MKKEDQISRSIPIPQANDNRNDGVERANFIKRVNKFVEKIRKGQTDDRR